MADVTAIQADLVERARLFIDEGASEDPRSLVEGLLMLLDLHDPPTAPVPTVTRDQAWKALSDLREEFELCDDTDCPDHWCALARRSAAALEALLSEAPQPKVLTTATLVHEALPHGGFRGHVIVDDNSIWDLPAGTPVAVVALGPPVPEAPEGGSDA